jgi:hypothetical protein
MHQGEVRVALLRYSADSVCGHDRVHRHRLLLLDQHRGALRNFCIAAPTIRAFDFPIENDDRDGRRVFANGIEFWEPPDSFAVAKAESGSFQLVSTGTRNRFVGGSSSDVTLF